MTVSTLESFVIHLGDGVNKSFPTTDFQLNTSTEVSVSLREIATGETTVLTPSQYGIPSFTEPTTTTITYPLTGPAITSAFALIISRETNLLQEVSVSNQTNYNASVVTRVWDKLHRIVQEQARDIARSPKLPEGSAETTLPVPEVGKLLVGKLNGWEQSVDLTELIAIETAAQAAADAAAASQSSAASAASSATSSASSASTSAATATTQAGLADTARIAAEAAANVAEDTTRRVFDTLAAFDADATLNYTNTAEGDIVRAGPYRLIRAKISDTPHRTTSIGLNFFVLPMDDGRVPLAAFPIVCGDRTAAAANSVAVNAADAYAAALNVPLCISIPDVLFFGARLDKNATWQGDGCGYWPAKVAWGRNLSEKSINVAETQFVATGTFTRNMYLPGVSDMEAGGATRVNPSPFGGLYNDAEYRWPSMMNTNGTLRAASIAIFDRSKGGNNYGYRVIPDFGGLDGQDGYEDDTQTVRSTANVDFGIVFEDTDGASYTNVVAVGHWRIAGRCLSPLQFWDGVGTLQSNENDPYYVTFTRCHFAGYVGSFEIGSDTYTVTAVSGSTIRVPWADTLTLRDNTIWDIVRYNSDAGYGSTNIPENILSVVQSGADAVITFDANVSARFTVGDTLIPRAFGGGNSHTTDNQCRLQGFGFSNGALAHDAQRVDAFDYPSMALCMSGHRMTERVFNDPVIQHFEEVPFMIHEYGPIIINNLELERTADRGQGLTRMRLIVSPSAANNTWHPNPSGGTTQFYLTSNTGMRFPGIDWGGALPVDRSTVYNGAGDEGMFEPNSLVFPTYSGSDYSFGSYLVAFDGEMAGIKKPGHPFATTVFAYDPDLDWMRSYVQMETVNANLGVRKTNSESSLLYIKHELAAEDCVLKFEGENSNAVIRWSQTGQDLRFQIDGNGDDIYDDVGRYEAGSTQTGWHFGVTWQDSAVTKTYRPYITGMTFGGAGGSAYRFDGEVAEFQLLDEAVVTINMSADAENLVATITSNSNSGEWGLIKCKTDAAPGGVAMAKSTNFTFRNPATALAGTTGTDGHLTFSPRQGSVQIENRTGSTKQFMFSMVAGLGS